MKNVNSWVNLILGFLATWYGYFLSVMILLRMFGAVTSEYIKFSTFITSSETMQQILITVLLIISGDYLTTNAIDKEEV